MEGVLAAAAALFWPNMLPDAGVAAPEAEGPLFVLAPKRPPVLAFDWDDVPNIEPEGKGC